MSKRAGERDYRDMKGGDGKPHPEARGIGMAREVPRQWWTLEGKECAQSIQSTVTFLQKNQQTRMRQAVVSARLYGNLAMAGAGGVYASLLAAQTAIKDRVTDNCIQAYIDTLVARVGETKPRPYFLTSGGNYRQQRKAKKLNQFVEGVFYEAETYNKGLLSFRDAAIWGDGFIHVFGRGGRICHERVIGAELWVDEVEAQYGFPRNLHRVKTVDRYELASYFPEKADDIMKASRSVEAQKSTSNLADMVTVVESWHLSAENEDGEMVGGKHVIALVAEGVLLIEPEDWPYDFFPFARVPWCERPIGYWSQGICEQLQGDQQELNKELWFVQRSMQLAGTVKIFLKNGSKVVKEELNNEVGAIVTYTGEAPQYVTPAPIHQSFFENPDRIRARMRDRIGISQLSAGGTKPAGLNSGRALREYEDIESDRHRTTQRHNDNLYLQVARLSIVIAREMAKSGRLKSVRVPGSLDFREVDFKKDIGSLKDDEFVMQCFPVSRLPRDPAGRLSTIQEYIQAGMITPRQGRKALDFADIDSIESLANAQEDLLTMVLDGIIDEGEYQPPEATDDLQLAKEMVIEYIQRYRALDLEPERLDLLHTWNQQVDMLIQQSMPPPPAAGVGAPQAAAAPPPVSDLVPNVPQPA